MKFAVIFATFAIGIGFNLKSVAASHDEHADGSKHAKEESHSDHGDAKSHHEKLSKRMNSLFPEKKADLSKSATPGQPKLVSPSFSQKLDAGVSKLEWSAGEGAEEYHVQVATDPVFKWLVSNVYDHKGTTFETPALEAGKTYYWRVLSVKPNNLESHRKSFWSTSSFIVK